MQVNDHTSVPVYDEVSNTFDVTSKMQHMVDTLCIVDLSKPVYTIWQAVSVKYLPADGIIRKRLTI
ncbi:hypothetical protein PI124_g17205 [Phytophthora idaei]|nr:hypothetical protein PI125_g13923 [Phytophthora idaei]KAG3237816.1 hypothetical protein PI124_g17205 [Phytophthora idaei]